jgi:putative transposase
MTNHVHLLITPHSEHAIARLLQSVGRRYVRYFNTRYRRTGTLWEGRYRAALVDSDRYLLACYRYIELNPVRSGQVPHAGDYRWSSYGANALGVSDPLVDPHPLYTALGGDPERRRLAYRALFMTPFEESTVAQIREATTRGWPLGNRRFRGQVTSLLKRRAYPLPRGGDRRSSVYRTVAANAAYFMK